VRFLGVEGPTSQQAPLYPTLLAVAQAFFGQNGALRAIEWLQGCCGAAIALVVALLGWTLFPTQRSIGWGAGWFAALFPPHVYMATQIQVVVWASLLLTLLLALAVRSNPGGGTGRAATLGAIAGVLLLVEPILALALPIVALAFCQSERRSSQKARKWLSILGNVALMASVAAAVIAPWLIRNYRVHGEFVFVKSTFGYAFWQGNNEISWGTDKVPKADAERLRVNHDGTLADMNRALWAARHETIYIDDLLLQPNGYREFQGLTEPDRSRILADRAWLAIKQDPRRYAKLCFQRLRYFLLFDETNPKAANRLYRATTLGWGVLAALGVLVSRRQWRILWPTYAIFAVVALFHTLTITSARFRMPLEPFTFVWVAAGVAPLLGRFGERLAALFAAARSAWIARKPVQVRNDGLAVPRPHIRTTLEARRPRQVRSSQIDA
jgi:hypothetical protein